MELPTFVNDLHSFSTLFTTWTSPLIFTLVVYIATKPLKIIRLDLLVWFTLTKQEPNTEQKAFNLMRSYSNFVNLINSLKLMIIIYCFLIIALLYTGTSILALALFLVLCMTITTRGMLLIATHEIDKVYRAYQYPN